MLRRRATEFIGKIVIHCGYQYIQNDIENLLTQVDQVRLPYGSHVVNAPG